MSACIVTGCSAGNGLSIARQLMVDGHQIVGVDRVFPITEPEDWIVQGDVLDFLTMTRTFNDTLELTAGKLYLINNASVTSPEFSCSDAA